MAVRRFLAALLVVFSGAAPAQTFDVNLSNDSALFRLIAHPPAGRGMAATEVDLGLLYTTSDDVIGMLGWQVVDAAGPGSPGLDVGVGVKAYAATSNNNDFMALALGGQARYRPAALGRLGFMIQGHYAPNIVAFMDADRFVYVSGHIEYAVLQQARAYLGYRKIRADIRGVDEVLESGGNIGLQIDF